MNIFVIYWWICPLTSCGEWVGEGGGYGILFIQLEWSSTKKRESVSESLALRLLSDKLNYYYYYHYVLVAVFHQSRR